MRTIFFCCLWTTLAFSEKIPELTTVSNVNLERYSGLWYEIARLPNSFETNCIQSMAEYSIGDDGHFNVLNTCIKANAHKRSAKGIIRVENTPDNSKLKVNFIPKWLRWSGLGWGDYWIIDLDPDYQYTVISEPNRDYLWILNRAPQMPKSTYDRLTKKLEGLHFNLSHLIVSSAQNSEPPALTASPSH